MKTTIYTFIISSCVTMMATVTVYAQAGSLDPTFGSGGIVTTNFGSLYDYGLSTAIQGDGKIVVAGFTENGSDQVFALARYNTDGILDSTFNSNGKVTTNIGGYDEGESVVIQSNGKIVVAGVSLNDFALVRYNTDGTLDSSFSSDGKVTSEPGNFADCRSVAIQTDDKIVMAGHSSNGTPDFALARYNSNGTLDSTFGGDGIVTTDFGSSEDIGNAMTIQSDGKIVVAGKTNVGLDEDFALARYNTDGTLDNTFDSDGKVVTAIGMADDALSITTQSDGKIVVAGSSNNGLSDDWCIVRYNSDGSLDNTFGSDGIVITNFGNDFDWATSVVIQSDGKIVVAGFTGDFIDNDFAIARYNSDGTLDNTFDLDGKVTTDIDGDNDTGWSVAIQSDGQIILAGASDIDSGSDFSVVRYNASNAVGIAENNAEEKTITLFPNPFSNELSIKGTAEKGEITILNLMGKEIMNQQTFDAETKIKTESLLPGFYLLNYNIGNKTVIISLIKF